ncbi:FAD:protein FMN transferase [Paenibacillus sp. sptzw28]|uniref:FAD:protein FMN transferase n=1 Tax=Paenibacillus sp. sptzw28 TaxID=715179 RepID=UPI001C6F117E|nr:FAD:protein FMN transferase [Paenibacillus sp. sptzw28]QYR22727.1 FAD:protein FMN transferase [Paenibacillus sp. sptzw28]
MMKTDDKDGKWVYDRFYGMNTQIETALGFQTEAMEAGEPYAWVNDVRKWFGFVEDTFSRFRPESELCRLNRSAGKPMFISYTMQEVLLMVSEYRRLTEGMFEPFILRALEDWGYNTSYDQMNKECITPSRLTTALQKKNEALELNTGMRAARLANGARIDLGGIVKGWSVDRLTGHLVSQKIKSGMLNAGGDLRVWGGSPLNPWEIEIADPRDTHSTIASVKLHNCAAATSSMLGRRWMTEQGTAHHLIDPRSMAPAVSDIVQCTVVGGTAVECDIFAKVLCMLGLEKGIEWLISCADRCNQALMVTENKEVHYVGTINMWERRWSGVSGVIIHDTSSIA